MPDTDFVNVNANKYKCYFYFAYDTFMEEMKYNKLMFIELLKYNIFIIRHTI